MAKNLPRLFEDSDLSGLPVEAQEGGKPWLDGVVPTVGGLIGVLGEMVLGENFVLGEPAVALAEAHSHAFANIADKPTTLAGYGIVDGGGLDETAVQDLIDSSLVGYATESFVGAEFLPLSGGTVSGQLVISQTNSDYINVGGAGSHLRLDNDDDSGQTVLCMLFDGVLKAKWRADFNGNNTFVALDSHYWFVGGDYGIGTQRMVLSNTGLSLLGILDVDGYGSTITGGAAPDGSNTTTLHIEAAGGPNTITHALKLGASGGSINYALRCITGSVTIEAGALDMFGNPIFNVGNMTVGAIYTAADGNLVVGDKTLAYVNTGGAILFAGSTTGQGELNPKFARIRGMKENGGYVNGLGKLTFGTQTSAAQNPDGTTIVDWLELSSEGHLFIKNTTEPATPTGGGELFVEGGALKFKGSSGTVTILGPA